MECTKNIPVPAHDPPSVPLWPALLLPQRPSPPKVTSVLVEGVSSNFARQLNILTIELPELRSFSLAHDSSLVYQSYQRWMKLRDASLVITVYCDTALASVALMTPVIFLCDPQDGVYCENHKGQCKGATNMFHSYGVDVSNISLASSQFLKFPFTSPLPPPNDHLRIHALGQMLVALHANETLLDSFRFANGKLSSNHSDDSRLTFYFVFTTTRYSFINHRCIESVLYHHPNARVRLLSNVLDPRRIAIFQEAGEHNRPF